MSCHPGGDYTPEDERLEPKNYPMEKENTVILQTIIFRFHVHLPRCIGDFLEHPKGFFLTKKDLLVKTSLLVDTVINLLLK